MPSLLVSFAEAHQADFTPETIRSYRSDFPRTVELGLGDKRNEPTGSDWLTHRFRSVEGVVVEICLPVDLTPAEAPG